MALERIKMCSLALIRELETALRYLIYFTKWFLPRMWENKYSHMFDRNVICISSKIIHKFTYWPTDPISRTLSQWNTVKILKDIWARRISAKCLWTKKWLSKLEYIHIMVLSSFKKKEGRSICVVLLLLLS